MKRFSIQVVGVLFLAATVLSSCQEKSFFSPDDQRQSKEDSTGSISDHFVPGEAYVKLSSSYDEASLRSVEESLTGNLRGISDTDVKLERIFPDGGKYEAAQRAAGLHLWMKATFAEDADLKEVFTSIKKNPNVSLVEGVTMVFPEKTSYQLAGAQDLRALAPGDYNEGYDKFNDPYLPKQWHYQNAGSRDGFFKAGADVNLFEAWKSETGKKGVIVAIMDSGIYAEHEDLAGSMWDNPEALGSHGYNFFDNTPYTSPGFHGTHVAGTIAARNNNGIGISGIAGGDGTADSGVRLMSCQIFSKDDLNDANVKGTSLDRISQSFVWAANHGAIIASCSWGFPKGTGYDNGVLPQVLRDAIDYFIDNAGTDGNGAQRDDAPMKGGVVIFAAGNESTRDFPLIPASYDRVVAVASFQPNYEMAYYSNSGDWVDILAPGGLAQPGDTNRGILSTISPLFPRIQFLPGVFGRDYTLSGDDKYAYSQGTSMATPHVSGIAALIASKFGKKGFTNDDLKQRLLTALKPINPDDANDPMLKGKIGKGYIDAALALEEDGGEGPTQVGDVQTSVDYFTATISWDVSQDNDANSGVAHQYVITLEDESGEKQKQTLLSYGDKVGTRRSLTFEGLADGTKYNYSIVAEDRFGHQSDAVEGTVTTTLNHAPMITNKLEQPLILTTNKAFYKKVYSVMDEDNHTWTLTVNSVPENVEVVRDGNDINITYFMTLPIGDYSLSFTLKDELGKEMHYELPFKILKYDAIRTIADFGQIEISQSETIPEINLADKFTSPIGLPLTFTVQSSNSDVVEATIGEEGQLLLVPRSVGASTIEVTATDGTRSLTSTFDVTILSSDTSAAGMYILYPVPTVDMLNIQTQSRDNLRVTITTVRGEVVLDTNVAVDSRTYIASINVKSLTPGVYNVYLASGGSKVVRRILKN